jgi:hypothetical protein
VLGAQTTAHQDKRAKLAKLAKPAGRRGMLRSHTGWTQHDLAAVAEGPRRWPPKHPTAPTTQDEHPARQSAGQLRVEVAILTLG